MDLSAAINLPLKDWYRKLRDSEVIELEWTWTCTLLMG